MISAKQALTRIVAEFPSLSEEFDESEGLLHIQIAAWSHLTQKAIDEENRELFRKNCEVFCELYPNASADLENELNVSYLENLKFKDGAHRRAWAYKAMPNMMRNAWILMEEYNIKIHGG